MVDARTIKHFRPLRLLSNGLIACLLCMQVAVCFAQDNVEIRLEDGLVWLESDNADLKHVLQLLSVESGFRLWVSANLQAQQVSVHIEKKSIEEVLRQLLAGNSYALVHDDNAVVTALHVLPPGKVQSTNVILTPEIGDGSQQALEEALESSLLPDNAKASLLDQFGGSNNDALKQSVRMQRSQAIEELIKQLTQIGSADPETIQQLQEKLMLENALPTQ